MTGRRRAPLTFLPAVVLTLAWLLVPATTAAGDPCYHGYVLPPVADAATTRVTVEPCAFSPTIARVPVGATVTFANTDFAHLITGANQTWGDRDVEVRPGTSVVYTFDTAGIYPYACALHRGMSGVIVVGDVGQGGAAPIPADAPAPPSTPVAASGVNPAALAAIVGAVGIVLGAGIALLVMTDRRRRRAPSTVAAADPAATVR